jgi:hypothetical protein
MKIDTFMEIRSVKNNITTELNFNQLHELSKFLMDKTSIKQFN